MRYGESSSLPARRDIRVYVRLALLVGMGIILFNIISSQSISFILNVNEFDLSFTKPVYYAMLAGLILASIVFIRVNIKNR